MENKQRKFNKEWFENVFWYHYKWWFLLGVFLLAVAIFITVEALSTEKTDFTVVIGVSGEVHDEDVAPLLDVVGRAVGDLDGNGRVNVGYIAVDLSELTMDSTKTYPALSSAGSGESNQTRMMLYLATEDYPLFLLDEETSRDYCALDFFDDRLESFGIAADPENPYRVSLEETGAVRGTGLAGYGLYGLLIDWTTVGKGSQKLTDAGVNALKAILAS